MKLISIKTTYYLTLAFCLSFGSTQADEAAANPGKQEILPAQQDFQNLMTAPGEVMFTPPENWSLVDPKALSKYVKVMVVGPAKGDFPPSINLAFDPFKGTTKDYLKIINGYNSSQGAETKNLGKLQTLAGEALLLQVESPTKWGREKQMQAILIHDGKAWILTTSALKDDYQLYYKDFFQSLKSLRINSEGEKKISS